MRVCIIEITGSRRPNKADNVKSVFLFSEIINQTQFIMKQIFILLIFFAVPLFCMAQSPLVRQYSYDAAGNRTICAVINLVPPPEPPPIPSDSTELHVSDSEFRVSSSELLELATEYFVEKIAQVEIKIYPNPTTEKITLAISGWEDLQTGVFQLYSLTGQLLHEHPVFSTATEVSLVGFPKGTYILKVNVNGSVQEWKIIKQ